MSGTPFVGKRLNNPDQKSVAYLAMHGIPRCSIDQVQQIMAPYREARNVRNRAMTKRLDAVFSPYGINLDFDDDVIPISRAKQGGTVTERHILFALAGKLISRFGAGEGLIDFISKSFDIEITGSVRDKLSSPVTPYYAYHLLGLLKGSFMGMFYIDASDELPNVRDFVILSRRAGAIPAYAYLGDVRDSVTGDKKDAAYEDAYLDKLIEWLPYAGFLAVTYMPARNTAAQLARIAALCERHNLFQISGEDINSPFQDFICRALEDPRHANLIEATWALIGHERAAANDTYNGMFSLRTLKETPSLPERIRKYAAIGHS